jgi:molybdopterin adenylyltransferase
VRPRHARVVVVSDRAAAGIRPDRSGPELAGLLEKEGFILDDPPIVVVPDELEAIVAALRAAVAGAGPRLVATTGGTGPAPRDVTPEATRAVLTRELPGFGELMRARSLLRTPRAAGSRAVAGTVGQALVVNLPGSPEGAVQCLGFVLDAARHVLDLLAGGTADCAPAPGASG